MASIKFTISLSSVPTYGLGIFLSPSYCREVRKEKLNARLFLLPLLQAEYDRRCSIHNARCNTHTLFCLFFFFLVCMIRKQTCLNCAVCIHAFHVGNDSTSLGSLPGSYSTFTHYVLCTTDGWGH